DLRGRTPGGGHRAARRRRRAHDRCRPPARRHQDGRDHVPRRAHRRTRTPQRPLLLGLRPSPAPSFRSMKTTRLISSLPICATLALAARADSPVAWSWTGGVTDTDAVVTARIETETPAALRIIETDTTVTPVLVEPMNQGDLHRYPLGGLKPDTAYTYVFVAADGSALDDEPRTFRTFPKPGVPTSFRFAVGSCARGMNSPVYDAAAKIGRAHV